MHARAACSPQGLLSQAIRLLCLQVFPFSICFVPCFSTCLAHHVQRSKHVSKQRAKAKQMTQCTTIVAAPTSPRNCQPSHVQCLRIDDPRIRTSCSHMPSVCVDSHVPGDDDVVTLSFIFLCSQRSFNRTSQHKRGIAKRPCHRGRENGNTSLAGDIAN